jgi:hypothetical protein
MIGLEERFNRLQAQVDALSRRVPVADRRAAWGTSADGVVARGNQRVALRGETYYLDQDGEARLSEVGTPQFERGFVEIVDSGAQKIDFPRMLNARSFCPVSLLPYFGTTGGLQAYPYYIRDLYADLATAQVDFPALTAGEYAANSLDWAVIQWAVDWASAHYNNTVHLDHGVYGVAGCIEVPTGVMICGQGSQGTASQTGTAIVHFDTCNLFYFSAAGTAYLGTGGGLKNLTLVKAMRATTPTYPGSGVYGLSYKGGTCILIETQSATNRTGEMVFDNVISFVEYTADSWWDRGLVAKGNNTRSSGAAGVRTIHMRKVRMTCCKEPQSSFVFDTVMHASGVHVACDEGAAGFAAAGIKIVGDCQNWDMGIMCGGNALIDDWDDRMANITNVTNASPMVVTLETPHGIPAGETFAVLVTGVGGCTNANNAGFPWDGATYAGAVGAAVATAHATDPRKFSIAHTGNAAYTSGGVAQVQPAAISGITGASPMVVATYTPHRQGLTGQTPKVFIENVVGSIASTVNDHWCQVGGSNTATIVDATHISLDRSGVGLSWTSGGTIRADSPKDINIHGAFSGLVCRSKYVTGMISGPSRYLSWYPPSGASFINASPRLRCVGPWTPHVVFGKTSNTANVTGNGVLASVPFDSCDRDDNYDMATYSAPFTAFVPACAGPYVVTARVYLSNVTAANNRADIRIHVVCAAGGTLDYTAAYGPSGSIVPPGGYFQLFVEERMQLEAGDAVYIQVLVTDGAQDIGIFGDSSSNYTMATFRME